MAFNLLFLNLFILRLEKLPGIRHFLILKAFINELHDLMDFPLISLRSLKFFLRLFYLIFELTCVSIGGILCCVFIIYGYSAYQIGRYLFKKIYHAYILYSITPIRYTNLPYSVQRRLLQTLSIQDLRNLQKTNKNIFNFGENLRGIPIDEIVFDYDLEMMDTVTKKRNDEIGLSIQMSNIQKHQAKLRKVTNLKRIAIVGTSKDTVDYWEAFQSLPKCKIDTIFFDGILQDFDLLQSIINKFTPDTVYCQIEIQRAQPPTLSNILESFGETKVTNLICAIFPATLFPPEDDLISLTTFYKSHSNFLEITCFLQQSETKWRKYWHKRSDFGYQEVEHILPFDFSKWILLN
uniref:F-box domain-containing protein n=1 Tax=Panagrolaimus sp. ES5 TaxID=591445 RepID=A0AC34G6K1_9BILA